VHHVGILYDQFMMHGQRNIKLMKLIFQNGNIQYIYQYKCTVIK